MNVWVYNHPLISGSTIIATNGQVVPDGALTPKMLNYFIAMGRIKQQKPVSKKKKRSNVKTSRPKTTDKAQGTPPPPGEDVRDDIT